MSGNKQVRRLSVLHCYPTHCTLQYDSSKFNIPPDAVVYMSPSDLTIIDVYLAGEWLPQERDELKSACNHPDHSFRLMDPENNSNTADVELSWVPDSENLGAKWKAPLLASDAMVELPVARGDMTRLLSVIRSISNFRSHFYRSVSSLQRHWQVENNASSNRQPYRPKWSSWVPGPILNLFGNVSYESESSLWTGFDNLERSAQGLIKKFGIHLYELEHDSDGFRVPKRETDYLVPSCSPIAGGKSRFYGIEVVNHSFHDVFAYLFYFNPRSYEIEVRLHDAYIALHSIFQLWSGLDDAFLPGVQGAGAEGMINKLMIGFGEGGGYPLHITPGETFRVG